MTNDDRRKIACMAARTASARLKVEALRRAMLAARDGDSDAYIDAEVAWQLAQVDLTEAYLALEDAKRKALYGA